MAASKRGGERGATLTLFAFVSGMTLLALGTVYLSAADRAYTYVSLGMREAQLYAAIDAGFAEAIEQLKHHHDGALNVGMDRDGSRVQVTSTPGSPATGVKIVATSGTGSDKLTRTLEASIDFLVDGRARVLRDHRN